MLLAHQGIHNNSPPASAAITHRTTFESLRDGTLDDTAIMDGGHVGACQV